MWRPYANRARRTEGTARRPREGPSGGAGGPSAVLLRAETHPVDVPAACVVEQLDLLDAVGRQIGPRDADPRLGRLRVVEPRRSPELVPVGVEVGPVEHAHALRMSTMMLTAVPTTTSSPAARSSGT